jgi:hypothetical protein
MAQTKTARANGARTATRRNGAAAAKAATNGAASRAWASEDVGNVVSLEHVNVTQPDQSLATLFYVVGMGFTRDPYLNVALNNMWINVGEQQFHLPTREPQVIPGHIGIVTPSLEGLARRLAAVQEPLRHTKFRYTVEDGYVAATCPWGNEFRAYAPDARFGDVYLGIPYVEFKVRPGTAAGIARWYQQVMGAPSSVEQDGGSPAARVRIGTAQWLLFRETAGDLPPYDGHHIAVYVASFSGPYNWLKERDLIMEEVRNHQFRVKEIVDPDSGEHLHTLEHEVRSLYHPGFRRPLINRDPEQSQRDYRRGHDPLIPVGA